MAVLATGLFGYIHYRDTFTHYNQKVVRGIAQTTASHIDRDEYRRLAESGEKTPYWDRLKAQFDLIKMQTGVKYLYALDNNVDGKIRFMVEGQLPDDDPAMICQFGDVLEEGSYTPGLFQALRTGQATVGQVHQVEPFGAMVSGYAPIIGADGRIIGVVGADIGMEVLRRGMNRFALLYALFALAVAAGLSFILFVYTRRTVDRPIDEVIEAAGRLIQDDFSGKDFLAENKASTAEIKRLLDSFSLVWEKVKKADALTGAYSRAAGLRALKTILDEGILAGPNCAAFVDVDGLKAINDHYGHLDGDFAIKSIAEALIDGARSSDMVCRYGGDEFLVLFRNCGLNAAGASVARIQEGLVDLNRTAGRPYSISFSYGLVEIAPGRYPSVDDLINELDALMYEDKQKTK